MSVLVVRRSVWCFFLLGLAPGAMAGDAVPATGGPSLEQLKQSGAQASRYLEPFPPATTTTPTADLATYREHVQPILESTCVHCHGEDLQEGNIRLDTLDPNLLRGQDVDWWLEVLAVLTNGEMPPPDEELLADEDRARIVRWLTREIQVASAVRRAEGGHSSFRRLTRYEYSYVLQDLLGLPLDFSRDLPPDPVASDGFVNSSETLQMSAMQFEAYRDIGRKAIGLATVRGQRPAPLYWGVSMTAAAESVWKKQANELEKIREQHKDDPEQLAKAEQRLQARFRSRPRNAYYLELDSGRTGRANWSYGGAKYAWEPVDTEPAPPAAVEHVAILPPGQRLIVELGDRVPDRGTLRVQVRASRGSAEDPPPSLQLEFGWQASNDSAASVRISGRDQVIDASPEAADIYQWDIPLADIYPRNGVRNISKMGDLPSPSEFIKFVNSSVRQGDVRIEHVAVAAPVYDTWPPESHLQIFPPRDPQMSEVSYAREVLTRFMSRAWRRPVHDDEIEQKLSLLAKVRPGAVDVEDALVEVLATVLASPHFLYLEQPDQQTSQLAPTELATRLSMFLWCSQPDETLLDLAARGELVDPDVLRGQVERMLADDRAKRMSRHFVRQWLGMQLLDYLDVDRKAYPRFDQALKESMQAEPVAFFHEMLRQDSSLLDFLHADYAMVNERLARHYELPEAPGNHFRRVDGTLPQGRGGLLTQAGLLAMNSDGKDSHPLKRGIWLLESMLNDPPPPPPPAVPEIDLADPEIAKLTLKQRIEDHRNQAACLSCHAKIDPWGIAFEHYDAVGAWRKQAQGRDVDATSVLLNGQPLAGVDGLKRFLLTNRQDQFVRAIVHKMTTFALGRPLTFADRAHVDRITADLRRQGDGLATMVQLIVGSDLFRSR